MAEDDCPVVHVDDSAARGGIQVVVAGRDDRKLCPPWHERSELDHTSRRGRESRCTRENGVSHVCRYAVRATRENFGDIERIATRELEDRVSPGDAVRGAILAHERLDGA